jgi:hypothetical protein
MGIAIAVMVAGVVVAVAAAITAAQGEKKGKQIFAELHARGLDAALALVDQLYPRSDPYGWERMAVLALIGDVPTLEREVPLLAVKPPMLYRAQAVGLLGFALAGKNVGPAAARMRELADRFEREAPRMATLPKKWMRAIAELGTAVDARDPSRLARTLLVQATRGAPMQRLLFWEAMIRVFELAGDVEKANHVRADLGWLAQVRQARAA